MFRRRLDVNAQTADLAATRANNLIVGSLRTPDSRISPENARHGNHADVFSHFLMLRNAHVEDGRSGLATTDCG